MGLSSWARDHPVYLFLNRSPGLVLPKFHYEILWQAWSCRGKERRGQWGNVNKWHFPETVYVGKQGLDQALGPAKKKKEHNMFGYTSLREAQHCFLLNIHVGNP